MSKGKGNKPGPSCGGGCGGDGQKITTFYGGYVLPNAKSNLALAQGVYSLSSQCNLPYVTFTGSNGFTKTISWGEYAEIPCGQMVTVFNSSAHPGNLVINSGIDPDPVPARITVPTRIVNVAGEFGSAQTKYLLDTRRAKRAYLFVEAIGLFTATVVGRTKASHDTENGIISPNIGSGYQTDHIIPNLVQCPPIPLGWKALMGDDTRPMALLDSALVAFGVDIGTPQAYFVAEYR